MTAIRGAAAGHDPDLMGAAAVAADLLHIDIKSPDADPAVMGERLLEVVHP